MISREIFLACVLIESGGVPEYTLCILYHRSAYYSGPLPPMLSSIYMTVTFEFWSRQQGLAVMGDLGLAVFLFPCGRVAGGSFYC